MNERLYMFKVNGEPKWMNIQEAILMQSEEVNARIKQIIENSKTKRMRHDAFEPGYQQNIEMHVTCPAEYQRVLKEKGLVEVGYDVNFREHDATETGLANKELIPAIQELGIDLSDNEIDGLMSGELLKDVSID